MAVRLHLKHCFLQAELFLVAVSPLFVAADLPGNKSGPQQLGLDKSGPQQLGLDKIK
jgi:hypothetical protein